METPANFGSVWESLSQADRETISTAFQPMGNVSAENMVTSAGHIASLVGYLRTPGLRDLGYRLIASSESLLSLETDPVQLHFYFQGVGKFFYRFRDLDNFALPKAIEAFEKQTRLSTICAPLLAKSLGGSPPSHAGFDQLRIIHEKAGNHLEAIKVCEVACKDGWAGDWEKHIKRLTAKIMRAG